MVDPVSKSAASGPLRRLSPVAPSTPAPPVATGEPTTSAAGALAKSLAAAPPVDTERVARIKKAIADGTFPILPAKVADRLLALKLHWKPHDPA
jgi:negative regulator of flagellin synthesis FlgM